MNGKCDCCGENVDYRNGGCALMTAFCGKDNVNFSNLSFCSGCYEKLIKEHLYAISNAVGFTISEKKGD